MCACPASSRYRAATSLGRMPEASWRAGVVDGSDRTSSNQKQVPTPSVERTPMCPPLAVTSFLAVASPSPVPGCLDVPTRTNGSKMRR